jgi:hypothetical protein
MAKENNSSGVSTPTKAATKSKQSTSRKADSQNRLHVVGAADALSGNPSDSVDQWTEPPAADIDQEIRLRAYQIYCERGGFDGAHEDDWHRAEREVRGKYEKFKYGT